MTHLASLFLPDALTRQVFVVVDYVDHGNDDGGCDIVTLAVESIISAGSEDDYRNVDVDGNGENYGDDNLNNFSKASKRR